jgi:hypothetical protein
LYYYVASDAIMDEFKEHTTIFKARKGTSDKVDDEVKYKTFVANNVPRVMHRAAYKMGRVMKIMK